MGDANVPDDFPKLDNIGQTRDALHADAKILGDLLKACRAKRRHWWHASLRPSLAGLTTGVVHAGIDFELELDLQAGLLRGRTFDGATIDEELGASSPAALAATVHGFLVDAGLDRSRIPASDYPDETPSFSVEAAQAIGRALSSVSAQMEVFRATLPEETSPIQLWPHHFDLSMLWLPGEKIAGEDPADEEASDKQMNIGFAFGDESVPEPYFYVTAYPAPDGMADTPLPAGAAWRTEGFTGATLAWRELLVSDGPGDVLQELWTRLVSAGRRLMLEGQGSKR